MTSFCQIMNGYFFRIGRRYLWWYLLIGLLFSRMVIMQLKYITLNVWFGGKLWDEMMVFLKNERPDVLTIQEAYDEKDASLHTVYRVVSILKKELGLSYSSFAPGFRLHGHDVGVV